jgi:hypothetical protein
VANACPLAPYSPSPRSIGVMSLEGQFAGKAFDE